MADQQPSENAHYEYIKEAIKRIETDIRELRSKGDGYVQKDEYQRTVTRIENAVTTFITGAGAEIDKVKTALSSTNVNESEKRAVITSKYSVFIGVGVGVMAVMQVILFLWQLFKN